MSLPAYEGLRLPGIAAPPARRALTGEAPAGSAIRRPVARPEPPSASPRSAALRLAGAERGCAGARDFVRRTLHEWDLEACVPDALTVVTELLANAVLHAAPPTAAEPAPEIWLRLSLRRPGHLVCAVYDPSDSPPVYQHTSDPLDEHGRGLRIIDVLAEHWGWTRKSPRGKAVWAMLPLSPRT